MKLKLWNSSLLEQVLVSGSSDRDKSSTSALTTSQKESPLSLKVPKYWSLIGRSLKYTKPLYWLHLWNRVHYDYESLLSCFSYFLSSLYSHSDVIVVWSDRNTIDQFTLAEVVFAVELDHLLQSQSCHMETILTESPLALRISVESDEQRHIVRLEWDGVLLDIGTRHWGEIIVQVNIGHSNIGWLQS